MCMREIEIRPITPTIGAEIHNVDLSKPLSDSTFERIEKALLDHAKQFSDLESPAREKPIVRRPVALIVTVRREDAGDSVPAGAFEEPHGEPGESIHHACITDRAKLAEQRPKNVQHRATIVFF